MAAELCDLHEVSNCATCRDRKVDEILRATSGGRKGQRMDIAESARSNAGTVAKFPGTCLECEEPIVPKRDRVVRRDYGRRGEAWVHSTC